MKPYIFLALIVCCSINLANAEIGNAAAGKEKSKPCQGCHGEDGNSINPLCPNLSGQKQSYIEKQIRDFQSGERVDSVMTGMSQGLISDQDVIDIAAYFSFQKPMIGEIENKIGRTIFREGKPENKTPSCASCHGENGKGRPVRNNLIPIIGGQSKDYIAKQLTDLRNGTRHNDPGNMMRNVVKNLTDEEIDALADYVSGL